MEYILLPKIIIPSIGVFLHNRLKLHKIKIKSFLGVFYVIKSHEGMCRVLKLVSAFVNVNGRDRVLNPGPLSRRPDKSTTTPRSDTVKSSLKFEFTENIQN
jgi:hypothetical protein